MPLIGGQGTEPLCGWLGLASMRKDSCLSRSRAPVVQVPAHLRNYGGMGVWRARISATCTGR